MENCANNNGFEYVDLGLPSGILWATCNVGANVPFTYGFYFQWGDTIEHFEYEIGNSKQFTWKDYKWNPRGDGKSFTKYKTECATLDLKDDAAHVHMGGDWHMPTSEQIQELIDNTLGDWIKQDGVNGRLFTSKKDMAKYIFIPAAGYALDGLVYFCGDNGYIWSYMLSANGINYGQYLCFDPGYAGSYNYSRYSGRSVRGVIG